MLYNGFGQAIDTFQSHVGAVNLSTTPSVQMAYAAGSANTIRPTGITYPDGRKIKFDYGAADSIHDQYSLVAGLIDSDMGTTHLADYQYLGFHRFLEVCGGALGFYVCRCCAYMESKHEAS